MEAASQWHQYVRKMSHLARWTFRSFHQGWKPERAFPVDFKSTSCAHANSGLAIVENQQDDDSTVVHVSAASFVNEYDNTRNGEGERSASYKRQHGVSIARAPLSPGESTSLPDETFEISPVMSDDLVIMDCKNGSNRTSGTSEE